MTMPSKHQLLHDIQGGLCFYCREVMQLEHATIDHVIPRSKGGKNKVRNYVLACKPCNAKKGDRLPTEDEKRLAAKIAEQHAQMRNRAKEASKRGERLVTSTAVINRLVRAAGGSVSGWGLD